MDITINVTFKGGKGTLEAILFGDTGIVDSSHITESGTIVLKFGEAGNIISVDGISPHAGTDVIINIPTKPLTPINYPEGPILDNFFIN